MDLTTFLRLPAHEVAQQVRESGGACWAIAMGGTRRAFLADGGSLAGPADMEAYFQWAEQTQRQVYEQLVHLGVATVVLVGRVPSDRGAAYAAFVRGMLDRLVCGERRLESYARLGLRVRVAGDLAALAGAIGAPDLPAQYRQVAQQTAADRGPLLIYLFRGGWHEPGLEEAQLGYALGQRLGRAPTRAELVEEFYGGALDPLSAYIGSGRPRLGQLRPPLLSGAEDLYWAHGPLMRLAEADWRRILYDQIFTRRTAGGRSYPDDPQSRAALRAALAEQDGRVIGLGAQHPLGFWVAQ